MKIDLETLRSLTALPVQSASTLAFRACVALGRRHRPGVTMAATLGDRDVDVMLHWSPPDPTEVTHQDFNKVTEEGAEALALALVCSSGGWRVKRRLQSVDGEGADWLLVKGKETLLLEVGGTDEARGLGELLREKLDQARASPLANRASPAACVVRFLEPAARYRRNDEAR